MRSALCAGSCTLPAIFALIHRSAWKWNSANFAITEFYEVRIYRILRTSPYARSPKFTCRIVHSPGPMLRSVLMYRTGSFVAVVHKTPIIPLRGSCPSVVSLAHRTARRSAALTLLPLPDQLLDRARQSRLEVDQLRPVRGHDDPDHAVVVERTHLSLPLDPLLGGYLVAAGRLEILVWDAIDEVQLGPTPDEQDLGRVHLGVDRQGDHWVLAQGLKLRSVLRSAHDNLRAVPGEPDRDVPRCAVLGDVGQTGHVASQQFLTDRSVQNLGDLVRLHSYSSRCRSRSIQRIVLVGRRSPRRAVS